MREPVNEWVLRNIELYHRRIYNEAEEFINRGLEVVIRTRSNSLYVFETINEHMYLMVRNLDAVTDEEIQKEFRRQLRYRMFLKYINQEDLADICGVTQATVSRYLTGDIIPNVFVIRKIAEALGCRVNDLIFQKNTYRDGWVTT